MENHNIIKTIVSQIVEELKVPAAHAWDMAVASQQTGGILYLLSIVVSSIGVFLCLYLGWYLLKRTDKNEDAQRTFIICGGMVLAAACVPVGQSLIHAIYRIMYPEAYLMYLIINKIVGG